MIVTHQYPLNTGYFILQPSSDFLKFDRKLCLHSCFVQLSVSDFLQYDFGFDHSGIERVCHLPKLHQYDERLQQKL